MQNDLKEKPYKPFFINSSLLTDEEDLVDFDSYMHAIGHNIGNGYITYALLKETFGKLVKPKHIKNIWRYDFSQQDKDIDYINNECTHCFLILQDHVRTKDNEFVLPYDLLENFISKLNKPIIVPGIGITSMQEYNSNFYEQISEDLVHFIKVIANHANLIGVRGYHSQEVLSKLGINNTEVIGCPTFYESGKNRIIKKIKQLDPARVIFAGDYNLNIIKKCPIIIQDGERAFIEAIAYNPDLILTADADERFFDPFLNKRLFCFSDMLSWKKQIAKHDFCCGNRVHSAIAALNCGVPSVILHSDVRCKEISEYFKIPFSKELIEENDVLKIYDFCDYEEMNKIYPQLYDRYVEFLNKNNVFVYDNMTEKDEFKQPELKLYPNMSVSQILSAKTLLKLETSINTKVNKTEQILSYQKKMNSLVNQISNDIPAIINSVGNIQYQISNDIPAIINSVGNIQHQISNDIPAIINSTGNIQHQMSSLNKPAKKSFFSKLFYVCGKVCNRTARVIGIGKSKPKNV